jgi:hypothetical protein
MATLPEVLKREFTMRRLGLAIVMLAAIPAIAIPLLACVVAISAPAALIAGVAAVSGLSHGERDARTASVTAAAPRIWRRLTGRMHFGRHWNHRSEQHPGSGMGRYPRGDVRLCAGARFAEPAGLPCRRSDRRAPRPAPGLTGGPS